MNAIAFKCLHKETRGQIKYPLEVVMQLQFTFLFTVTIQWAIVFLDMANFYDMNNMGVAYPELPIYAIAKFVVTMIMHLMSEPYVRAGLNMMKYVIKHEHEFLAPKWAFMIGFMMCSITEGIAISCVFKILNQTDLTSVLSSYVAYTAIAFLPNFAHISLPAGSVLKKATPDLVTSKW